MKKQSLAVKQKYLNAIRKVRDAVAKKGDTPRLTDIATIKYLEDIWNKFEKNYLTEQEAIEALAQQDKKPVAQVLTDLAKREVPKVKPRKRPSAHYGVPENYQVHDVSRDEIEKIRKVYPGQYEDSPTVYKPSEFTEKYGHIMFSDKYPTDVVYQNPPYYRPKKIGKHEIRFVDDIHGSYPVESFEYGATSFDPVPYYMKAEGQMPPRTFASDGIPHTLNDRDLSNYSDKLVEDNKEAGGFTKHTVSDENGKKVHTMQQIQTDPDSFRRKVQKELAMQTPEKIKAFRELYAKYSSYMNKAQLNELNTTINSRQKLKKATNKEADAMVKRRMSMINPWTMENYQAESYNDIISATQPWIDDAEKAGLTEEEFATYLRYQRAPRYVGSARTLNGKLYATDGLDTWIKATKRKKAGTMPEELTKEIRKYSFRDDLLQATNNPDVDVFQWPLPDTLMKALGENTFNKDIATKLYMDEPVQFISNLFGQFGIDLPKKTIRKALKGEIRHPWIRLHKYHYPDPKTQEQKADDYGRITEEGMRVIRSVTSDFGFPSSSNEQLDEINERYGGIT